MTATAHRPSRNRNDHPLWTDGVDATPDGGGQLGFAYRSDRARGVPDRLDVTTPILSRIHNHLLGGAHTFGVDRAAAAELTTAIPALRPAVWAARGFLHRAIVHLASHGVDQFLDIGCGIPTLGATHEMALRGASVARVVYVDRDLVAVLTARSMVATTSGVVVLHADLRRPLSILDQIRSTAVPALDLSRPVALILGGVLGCLADADAYLAVTHLGNALARGSYLVITHATPRLLDKAAPAAARSAVAVLRRTPTRLRLRGYADVARFFNGWTLTAPGLIEAARWRLQPDEPTHKGLAYPDGAVLAGVARKTRVWMSNTASCTTVH